ncbi:type VI toxin-antitoxin system SocA family antitoxin [Phaeobacter italicus]|uniref:type VI toxin-antitoxin system SocA family antitoxin n=1 Tax=Phaeobacter italicus TaxID=481446 RepID=UPI003CD0D6B4
MDDKGLDSRSVANYILVVRKHFGFDTTNLELQKLLFFCHGKFLVKYGRKLSDGNFEAWEHGPVHPIIYREFKEFGSKPISRRAESTNLVTGKRRVVEPPKEPLVKSHIAEVVLELRELTAWQLRDKSHAVGGPWHSVWESAKINVASQVIIPDSVIRERYHRHISAVAVDDVEVRAVEDHPPKFDRSC